MTDLSTEIYRHDSFALSQCDTRELYTLRFGSEELSFKLCDLIAFKKKIFAIDLKLLFEIEHADIEILYLAHLDRHILLSIEDILNLRELLSGTFTLLHLNSLIHRALYNPFEGHLSA